MKIDEIITAVSQTNQYLSKWQHLFLNLPVIETTDTGYDLKIYEKESSIGLGLFDKDTLISYVELDKSRNDIWQMSMQATDSKYRLKGYIRFLIEYAVKKLKLIITDDQQTIQAQQVYTNLIMAPHHVIYSLYNTKTKEKIKLIWEDGKIIPNPWDDNPETVIMMQSGLTESIIRHEKKRDEWRKKIGRLNEWYGDGFIDNP
jgi:hypothetical protein